MKQIDGDILKDKLKALLEHYQYRDDDFAIGRTCALADAMELIDTQEEIEAIPIEWIYQKLSSCASQYEAEGVKAFNRVLNEWERSKQYRKIEKVYYFITVFEKLDIDEHGYPDTGSNRCWGFYCEKRYSIPSCA